MTFLTTMAAMPASTAFAIGDVNVDNRARPGSLLLSLSVATSENISKLPRLYMQISKPRCAKISASVHPSKETIPQANSTG
jgi:hypothetical protein